MYPAAVGTLGAFAQEGACLVGTIRVAGDYRQDPSDPTTLLLTPDHAPGVTLYLRDYPRRAATDRSAVEDVLEWMGPTGRVGVGGCLMSDRTVFFTGWSKYQPNQIFPLEDDVAQFEGAVAFLGGTFLPEHCTTLEYFERETEGRYGVCLGQGAPTGSSSSGGNGGQEEEAPPPWEGEEVAVVDVDGLGIPENVTVIIGDGDRFGLAASSDPTRARELATTAPQGTQLVVTGRWDPGTGLVEVHDWYIRSLGPGQRKYGVTPEGDVVEQDERYPSTDWPGGYVPPEEEEEPATTAAGDTGPLAWVLGGALLLAAVRRKEP